ncbi:hypothetical protein [Saliterribacillus persicus]|uniref:Uncharacterized protein n=1 Tax=Saliterribacillus persicus TaxID=930114 RepID=A0A368X4L0_9BACI|nr:hypothetical protein [Saliterribacillus persicus]RCW62873.1 hypothetical protein DFR57_12242 [Saliterribacillus persicus]
MKYYSERNNLFEKEFSINLKDFKEYFIQVYRYYDDRKLFDMASNGVWKVRNYNEEYQLHPPKMAPSPEVYFITHLNKRKVYPIWEYYASYSEGDLFTVIEILYDNIGTFDHTKDIFIVDEYKCEFAIDINNLLKKYNNGYYLNEKYGYIMEQPNDSIKELLNSDIPNYMSNEVSNQLKTSLKMYYRFNSNEEEKKKAINILADILEPLRRDLQDILNSEFDINKKKHDKLIFDIVNSFNIRHNDKNQFTLYSKPIWYEWMMQYYTSVILTYYRLKSEHE